MNKKNLNKLVVFLKATFSGLFYVCDSNVAFRIPDASPITLSHLEVLKALAKDVSPNWDAFVQKDERKIPNAIYVGWTESKRVEVTDDAVDKIFKTCDNK